VTGTIDGGAGENDIFVFRMNGSSGSIPGGFLNFESFGAYGPGTLTLALNQSYNTIELWENANLTLEDGAGTVSQIKGDDTAQVVTINDADFVGGVSLGGGNDTLSLQLAGALAGALDGGAGTDTLNLNLTAPSTINDLFNFEVVNASGASPLTLTGTLGAGQQINFDGSDNSFIVETGAVFQGNANGGEGTDTLRINSGAAASRTIVAGQLRSFERLIAGGQGTLALNDESYSFQTVEVEGNLSIGNGASLASASGVNFGAGDNRLTLEGTATVTSPIDGGDGIDTLAFALAQGQMRDLSSIGDVAGFERLAAEGAGTLNINQNSDRYRSLDLGVGSTDGGNASIAQNITFSGDVIGSDGANTLAIQTGATVDGDVTMGAGNDTVDNFGRIDGDLNLGDGNDRYVARSGGVVTGTIDGGAGDNTFIFRLENAEGEIPGSVLNFNSFGAYGPGTLNVSLDNGEAYANLELLEGANLVLSGTNGSVGNVIGDDSAQSVTINGALTGGVSLAGGNDSLTMELSGLLQGALDGGAGTDTLNLTLTGISSIAGMYGFEIANVSGASPLTLTGDLGAGQQVNFTGDVDNELIIAAGVKFEGTVNGGGGHDLLRVQSGNSESRTVVASQIVSFEDLISEGAGTLALTGGNYSFESVAVNGGNFELGANTRLDAEDGVTFDAADNRFTLASGASVVGNVDGGAGNDTLALVQAAGTTRVLSDLNYTGFEALAASGAGELNITKDAAFSGGVSLDGGTTRLLQGVRLAANVTGGGAGEILQLGGTIEGNLDLGAGNDTLALNGAGTITGTRNGGEGTDRLLFNTAGTDAAPTAYSGDYSSFELLEVSGGVVSLTADSSWTGVAVTGGRLIGQAGTTITSTSAIQVAKGATFGSAGTVNADINVLGTLSPGASPGTMTVNGNVAFAAGSNLLLEVSPTVSDLLRISGKLTIADGAAVDITGALHGTPGNTLDLIVAQGGITGRFTTINKSNDIFGFVVQNGNKLQIQSEFLNDDAYPTNVQASVDYANEVLREGYGVQAFTAALPRLVDAQGAVNQQAFGQLTPEAYGSAIQLGEENSLLILDGVRTAKASTARAGLYSFGQFLTAQADVNATNGRTGAGASHITSRGFLGGVGYGFGEGAQIGAFIGGLDGKQTVRALGAKTEMDALAGGMFADATFGAIGLHGLVAVNSGKAETSRDILASDGVGKAKYGLTSWVADVGVDYQVRFGAWAITPKLGVSYVHTDRGTAREQGLGDFSLTVDKGSKSNWYGEAAVTASGSFDAGGIKITPFAQLGVRQLLGDARVRVSGGYTGADAGIVVDGIERERTALRAAIGLGVDMSEGVRLQAGYSGEFAGTKRDSVMAGLSVRF
jgi:fibronectin-binding autotransporter adhesin